MNDDASRANHSCIILFYKYFLPSDYPWLHQHPQYYEKKLLAFLKDLCQQLSLKGRLLVAAEGVNGTLSASTREGIDTFIRTVESFELVRESGDRLPTDSQKHLLFSEIDWKHSSSKCEPFPDLKITIVKEIIASGDAVSVGEIKEYGGQHLDARAFHRAIEEDPNVVLIDVRNPIEYDIGHFVHPSTDVPAVNPSMVTFASFDSGFCAVQAEKLKDKNVLLYCTGGVRCEKASVMLKKRGVKNVSQLQGGIHRYLEEFGDEGYFKGLNFVFDRRVSMTPSECKNATSDSGSERNIVGRCYECNGPYDKIAGSTICSVCRDVCLFCDTCQIKLREYHCRRHGTWKSCYFTFLECFDCDELESQRRQLIEWREKYNIPGQHKNTRRTLTKQIDKLTERIRKLESGDDVVDRNAPRRCRSCFEPLSHCQSRCWGFWKAECGESDPKVDDRRNLDSVACV